MASVCWWFYISKVLELFDTLFFILRKKNSQVTSLHVYHHGTMIWNWWVAVKYVAGGQRKLITVHLSCYTVHNNMSTSCNSKFFPLDFSVRSGNHQLSRSRHHVWLLLSGSLWSSHAKVFMVEEIHHQNSAGNSPAH